MATHLLYEAASGFALFENKGGLDEVGGGSKEVQASVADFERFGKVVKLVSFTPFTSAADALEQINAVSESVLTESLKDFLALNMPKSGEKKKKSGGRRLASASRNSGAPYRRRRAWRALRTRPRWSSSGGAACTSAGT